MRLELVDSGSTRKSPFLEHQTHGREGSIPETGDSESGSVRRWSKREECCDSGAARKGGVDAGSGLSWLLFVSAILLLSRSYFGGMLGGSQEECLDQQVSDAR